MEPQIERYPNRSWASAWTDGESDRCAQTLESGGVVVLPDCRFEVATDEGRFLDARWLDGSRKNISLDGERIGGSNARGADAVALRAMIARFAAEAAGLVERMLPRYAHRVSRARTSFRPAAVAGRSQSPRHDDTRLHVDAFPTRPCHGERILRVFCNVNPQGVDRVWRVGEPFEAMAAHFLPHVRPMRRGEAALLSALRVTKGRRSEYDHAMLALHDLAKLDEPYQVGCRAHEVHFATGTTWLCFSDQVMHAVMSGQYMMEQTLHVPLDAMRDREASPLAVLERLSGHPMA
jgi:hypothetical protein